MADLTAKKRNEVSEDSDYDQLPTTDGANSTAERGQKILQNMGIKVDGKIKFPDSKNNKSDYIYIPATGNLSDIQEIKKDLFQNWFSSNPPLLVISVICGEEDRNMNDELKRELRNALYQLAENRDIWIITDGLNTGISKRITEIIKRDPNRSRRIQLIGIPTPDYVASKSSLLKSGGVVEPIVSKELVLEPNHAKFIFVEDIARDDYNWKVSRTYLEGVISDYVPVVLLVVGGDLNTVRTVKYAMTKYKIPAVFLEGTGHCCNLFANALRLYREYYHTYIPAAVRLTNTNTSEREKHLLDLQEKLHKELRVEINAIGSSVGVPDGHILHPLFGCIHEKNELINILNSNSNKASELVSIIFRVLVNATSAGVDKKLKEQECEKLRLALDFNCIDGAKTYIKDNYIDWRDPGLDELFVSALICNQFKFVELFLEKNFSITKLFQNNNSTLIDLYKLMIEKDRDCKSSKISLLEIYNEHIKPCVGDLFDITRLLPKKYLSSHHESFPFPMNDDDGDDDDDDDTETSKNLCVPPDVNTDLFLWSIITTRHELAILFWSRVKNKVCIALFATLWYKHYANEKGNEDQINTRKKHNRYYELTEQYENFASQIIKSTYEENPEISRNAIIQKIPSFGNTTLFEIAIAADARQFIAQQAYSQIIFLLLFSYLILCGFFPLYDFPADICPPVIDSKDDTSSTADNNDDQSALNRNLTINTINTNTPIPYGFQRHKYPSIVEFILLFWIVTLLFEEIRQLIAVQTRSMQTRLTIHVRDFWNQIDALAIILFFIGFILRCLPISECFCMARVVLSFDLIFWFGRSLSFFAALKQLGPKLVMIGEMINDLKFFMLMLIVFILAFGISSYSLIHGLQKLTWHLPRDILNHAYWQIFGELSTLAAFTKNYKLNGYVAFILLVVYMAFVSILMINLLIAMFSHTFEKLQEDADRIWKYQRYLLVSEYYSRSSLPPPLIIFSHLWQLTIQILGKCCRRPYFQKKLQEHSRQTNYKYLFNEKISLNFQEIEDKFGANVYSISSLKDKQVVNETKFDDEAIKALQKDTLDRIQAVEKCYESIKSQQNEMLGYLIKLMESMDDSKTLHNDIIRQLRGPVLDVDKFYIPDIPVDATWSQNGITVAHGLDKPCDLFVDDDQTIVIADWGSSHIVQWKKDDMNGQVVVGSNDKGNRSDQIDHPTGVLIDKETNSLIICDCWNNRVVRWSRQSGTAQGEILIDNIDCHGLAMDDQKNLYVSNYRKNEVGRYQIGDKKGTLVAGGNGYGNGFNQFNSPAHVFVDRQQAVYVPDCYNHRVMKWNKGAAEGIVVAGGQGQGNSLAQLSCPNGLFVDRLGTLYIADSGNNRVIRWPKEAKEGTVIVGGNGKGSGAHQLGFPRALSFDRHGNMYVVDEDNNRVQRFSLQ
ncbi:unnamed protein product [Rotaria socialis]|uniref:Uncharacterized protein n=1 Tax=Rotaria socialis TaxID=392032 RepID=A0A818RYV3_9BILA|nr:unnamed protein product [Rotaria socialis]